MSDSSYFKMPIKAFIATMEPADILHLSLAPYKNTLHLLISDVYRGVCTTLKYFDQ
jgi:hypothetical protein